MDYRVFDIERFIICTNNDSTSRFSSFRALVSFFARGAMLLLLLVHLPRADREAALVALMRIYDKGCTM
ncbi:MAG: hypothetical protein ACI353_07235 [Alloprevotella sp.]